MAKIRKGDKVVVLTGHERDEKPVVIGTASPDHDAAVSEKGAKAAAKTIVVKVERRYTHPLLKKTVRRGKSYGGHKVLSVMTDGTPLLEAVAKPTIFTKEQISDTIRNVMAERMAKTPTRYAG